MYSEQAIQHFYNWEMRGRGYLLYPYPVPMEPPFQPFFYSLVSNTEYVDDGKVPSLLKRVSNVFTKKKEIVEEVAFEEEIFAIEKHYTPLLKQINISFNRLPKFNDLLLQEFLNMLSETIDQVSFEIIGKYDEIKIQIVCSYNDERRIENLLNTYFPELITKTENLKSLPFEYEEDLLLLDFGYDEEFMRPITSSSGILTGIISVLNNLRHGETAMLQVIFKGVNNSWSDSILHSVSMGGEPFFADSPEMMKISKEKVSSPLFGVIVRLAVEATHVEYAKRLAYELIQNIKTASRSSYNSLIPLSSEGYEYDAHLDSLKWRGTNRLPMIMNSKELGSFVYFPESPKLISSDRKTKLIPQTLINNTYLLGTNTYAGYQQTVTLNDEQRLRHTHIIGATGTGKSTLITNLFLEDVRHGNGAIIFDPHGDTVDEIISRIPKHRLNDVILIDPSDYEYSFKINLLSANTEVEKIVLSSDLVEAFRRHSTSWGDQMTSVLSNTINTFLESSQGGTLLDLKRFLIENTYRKEFLKTVSDKNVHYYWNNEYPLLKKGSISPLLTRLDTFLRPKLIRNILSSKEGLDFNEVLSKRKILLVKLSQGLIGEENSFLLGTLILAKIYQVAQGRQSLSVNERHPFYVYLDEFHNFITPSIKGILSGARKYNLGLILGHQELNQIKDVDVYNSLISNINIRICFRVGDADAKKLESSFSFFDSKDLQNLNIGEAVAKVGRSNDDFSLNTEPLSEIYYTENAQIIIDNSRRKYSKKVSEIEKEVILPPTQEPKEKKEEKTSLPKPLTEEIVEQTISDPQTAIEKKAKEYLESFTEKEEIREHRYMQTLIKKMAEQRGFKAVLEEEVDGGRVDVSLIKDGLKIACEIAHHNSAEYEVKNISKCLNANFSFVCIISKSQRHLDSIQRKACDIAGIDKVRWFKVEQLIEFLDSLNISMNPSVEQRVRGYRVRVNMILK